MSQICFLISQRNPQHLDTSPWFRLLLINSAMGLLGPSHSQQNNLAGGFKFCWYCLPSLTMPAMQNFVCLHFIFYICLYYLKDSTVNSVIYNTLLISGFCSNSDHHRQRCKRDFWEIKYHNGGGIRNIQCLCKELQ